MRDKLGRHRGFLLHRCVHHGERERGSEEARQATRGLSKLSLTATKYQSIQLTVPSSIRFQTRPTGSVETPRRANWVQHTRDDQPQVASRTQLPSVSYPEAPTPECPPVGQSGLGSHAVPVVCARRPKRPPPLVSQYQEIPGRTPE